MNIFTIVPVQQGLAPILCITALGMIVCIFIYGKWAPKEDNEKKKLISNEIQVGNTQWIGRQDIKKEYFSTIAYKGKYFAALACGLGRGKNGTMASVIAVNVLKTNFYQKAEKHQTMKEYAAYAVKQIEKNLDDALCDNGGRTAFFVFIVEHGCLEYAYMGHCYLLLYRKGELFFTGGETDGQKGLKIGAKKLQKKDKVLLMSQGAYKGLTEMEIIEEMKMQYSAQQHCDNLLGKIRDKQFMYQQNATLIIMENL